jgi:hypothetical protein
MPPSNVKRTIVVALLAVAVLTAGGITVYLALRSVF